MLPPHLLHLPKIRLKYHIKTLDYSTHRIKKKIHQIVADKSVEERLPVEWQWCRQQHNRSWQLNRGHARSRGRDPHGFADPRWPETRVGLHPRRPETRLGLRSDSCQIW
jgi:hypothetical protein